MQNQASAIKLKAIEFHCNGLLVTRDPLNRGEIFPSMPLHLKIRLHRVALTAIILGMACHFFALLLPLHAQELDTSSVDWSQPTGNETLETPTNTNSLALPQSPTPTYQKGGFQLKNLFKKKEAPVDVEKLIQVGPRQYADTTGSLLRLSAPVCLNSLTLPPGIYLAQLQRSATATATISQAGRTLVILNLTGQPFSTDSTGATVPAVSIQEDQLLIHDKTHVWVADLPTCQIIRY